MKNSLVQLTWAGALVFLVSCAPARPPKASEGHLTQDDIEDAGAPIPAPVKTPVLLPKPKKRPPLETYTVVVDDVPLKELLFSMARDAKLNLDINNDVTGKVTLNAIDQTLPQILDRITQQTDIRYRLKDKHLVVEADTPFIRRYPVDYLNMARNSKGKVSISTSVGSSGSGNIGGQSGGGSSNARNDSSTEMQMESDNQLWNSLTRNIAGIIGDKIESSQSGQKVLSTENVIVNREAGIIAVNTTSKKQAMVQAFLDDVMGSAKRQVMIEATIAEVKLSDSYQSGVDWSVVSSKSDSSVKFSSDLTGADLSSSPFSLLTLNSTSGSTKLGLTLKALEQFGDVKVLSSPKVMALNNQTAMLKVVDNIVYFDVDVNTTGATTTSAAVTTYETQINTVPIGFVLSVTPFINANDVVTLNVRPTISRVIDKVNDPNPSLAKVGVKNEIPVVQVREIESVLKINDGDTAVIGGLMQDVKNNKNTGVPVLSSIPWIGKLFSYDSDSLEKSELIIFIRPVVVKQASVVGDLHEYKKYLPVTDK